MSAPCSNPLADVAKITEVAKVRMGSVFQLECVPASAREDASDIACASVIVCVQVVVDPLVVSSDCTDCDKIDRDGGVSSSHCGCCREP